MTRISSAVFWGLIISLWMLTMSRGDTDISCVFMERCILPCSSQGSTEITIHWFKTKGDLRVHSFYHNQDQLGLQDQHFRGRTSLFKDQISRENTSLQLTEVKVQDEGRYECRTRTTQGNLNSFINLKVNAPVEKVNIQQEKNGITCSSEGIYPKPELTWTTSPPSNMTLHYNTTVQQTEQQLYNISSSLMLSNNDNDLDYSCTVSTHRKRKRATLRPPSWITGSYTETTIPCSTLNISLMSLIWRFSHSQTILNKTGTDTIYTASEAWMQHIKDVSKSGSLTLQDLSSKQEGLYTCELSDAEETIITHISVKISQGNAGGIIGGVIIVLLFGAAITGLVLFYKRKRLTRAQQKHVRQG